MLSAGNTEWLARACFIVSRQRDLERLDDVDTSDDLMVVGMTYCQFEIANGKYTKALHQYAVTDLLC